MFKITLTCDRCHFPMFVCGLEWRHSLRTVEHGK
jgi:hypothetical protein